MPHAVREFPIAIITIIVLALAMTPIGKLMPRGQKAELWQVIPIGIVQAVMCGFAYWLGWGGSRVLFRLIVAGIGLYLLYAAFSAMPGVRMAPFAIITLCTSMIAATPRFFGLRQCRLSADDVPESTMRDRQFSLVDLFLWTMTAALLAGTARWVDLSDQMRRQNVEANFIASARLAICTLAAMWAMLTLRGHVWMRLTIAIGLVAVVEAVIYFSRFGSNWIPAVVYPTTAIVLCLAFFVLRCRGFRIARNQSIRFVTSDDSHETLPGPNPLDTE
jgi:hypothetical protein